MYNAFISYSHAADGKLAPALEKALQRFGIPWWKKRVLNIFRDEASLSASPHLWSNITAALDDSKYLIYMASPESASSRWVKQEIGYWLEHKSLDTLLIALTDGNISWNEKESAFNNKDSNSLPDVLEDKFREEPFYIDLRSVKQEEEVSLKNPIFQKEVLKLAAQLHGKAPKDLASDELRAQKRWTFIRNIAFVVLAALLTFSVYQTILAKKNEQEAKKQTAIAREQARKAIANSLTASSNYYQQINPTLSFRLAEYALRFDNASIESYGTLLRSFYSNPHVFQDQVYGSNFYNEENVRVPIASGRKTEDGTPIPGNWPYDFIKAQGIALSGEFQDVRDIIYSPKKNYALFFYEPNSDNAEYNVELWDLKDEYNKPGEWNPEKQDYNKKPFFFQYLSYTQIDGIDKRNFSSDDKYAVVPKDNKALLIALPTFEQEYSSYPGELFQFTLGSSGSQVTRACFKEGSHIVNTVDLKGDTISFDLEKFALTKLPLKGRDIYTDIKGEYVLSAQGNSAVIWDLAGKKIGSGTLNNKRDGFTKAPTEIANWKEITLKKLLPSTYYESYGFEKDSTGKSSDGALIMNSLKITDANGKTILSLSGHASPISSVDISDNGELFLTATCPKGPLPETKLWDKKGNELLTLTGFGGKVGFLPGGKAIYTYTFSCCVECTPAEEVIIWPIDKTFLIDWVGKNKIHTLTAAEIDQFGIDTSLLSTPH